MRFVRDLLAARWLWITVFGSIFIALLPFPALFVYLRLPSWAKMVALISLLAAAGIAAGLRDHRST